VGGRGAPRPLPGGPDAPSAYALVVAYDDDSANRISASLGPEPGLTGKKTSRELAFLIGGNPAVTASHHGGVVLCVRPDDSDRLVAPGPGASWSRGLGAE
jgi:hypothetical protein